MAAGLKVGDKMCWSTLKATHLTESVYLMTFIFLLFLSMIDHSSFTAFHT